jgi:hypothetical protein
MDTNYPPAAESRARLERAGWSLTVKAVITSQGLCWRVTGRHGAELLATEGDSEFEAWHRACRHAQGLGLLGK